MRRSVVIIFGIILSFSQCAKAQMFTEQEGQVSTIVQAGHNIVNLDISPDKKYVLSSNEHTIALWDLEKRRIVRLITLPNTDARFHPLNPSWMMVKRRGTSYNTSDYYTYNIFTGKRLGVRKEEDLIKKSNWIEDYIIEQDGGVVTLKSRRTGEEIGKIDGSIGYPVGRLALSRSGDLLMQSGFLPFIWDLRNADVVGSIPYLDYLKADPNLYFRDDFTVPLPKSDTYRIKKNWFHYGYRNFFEGYFTDNDEILLGGFNANITRWNINGELLDSIKTAHAPIFSFVDNGEYRAAATYGGLNMGRVSKDELLDCPEFNKTSSYKLLCQISPVFREQYFVTGGDDKYLIMGQLGDPKFRKNLLKLNSSPMSYDIDETESTILVGAELAGLREVPIDNPQKYFRYNTSAFNSSRIDCAIYLNDDWIAAGCSDGLIGFWQRGNKDVQSLAYVHKSNVVDLKLSHDGKWMFSADDQGMIRIWNTDDRTPVMDMYHLGRGDDYIFLTPDNYYKASKGAFDIIHFAKGMEILSFEQFDLIYNRPDIVLQRLGRSEEETMPYYLAWKKRLRRMGYTEDMLSGDLNAPELTIINEDSIPKTTSEKSITLNIRALDKKYNLSRLLVSLNGVPLYGKQGATISKGPGQNYEQTIDIKLSTGQNRIDVSCMNDKGVESYRKQLELYCEAPASKPKLFVAAVGVSDYSQSAFNLSYARQDASDFAEMMSVVGTSSFESVESMVLADSAFDVASLTSLRDFFSNAGRDDVVMLFYAGHGVLDENMDYYLSSYAMDFNSPKDGGIFYDDFEACLESTESVHRFCFIDACHSGEIDKEDYLDEQTELKQVGTLVFRNVGSGVRKIKGQGVMQVQKLFNELFVDVRWGVGATILSSSGGMEVSLEGNTWQNGLFTWCLKQGILDKKADLNADNKISTSELIDYVSREVNILSGGVQTPSVRQENRQQDLILVQ